MLVAEIFFPGMRVIGLPDRDAWNASKLTTMLSSSVTDAAVALEEFEQSTTRFFEIIERATNVSIDAMQDEAKRIYEIQKRLEVELEQCADNATYMQASIGLAQAAEIERRRERWHAGEIPRSYQQRVQFLHARSFLFALDYAAKGIGALGQMVDAPIEIADIERDWVANFPTVRLVRDSAHHLEDRTQGLGKFGKPLELKPVDAGGIFAPGANVVINDSLSDNRYGCTVADGTFAEVDVSAESLLKMQQLVQRTIYAYQWDGPGRMDPY